MKFKKVLNKQDVARQEMIPHGPQTEYCSLSSFIFTGLEILFVHIKLYLCL